MATTSLMTPERFDKLPPEEGLRYELLHGEMVEMSSANPVHKDILTSLIIALGLTVRRQGGAVLPDTEFAFGESRLRPDLAVLPAEVWKRMDHFKVPVSEMPAIAVEIVSPSESAYAVDKKTGIYLQAGISEVWVIYPETKHLYVHTASEVRHLTSAAVMESPLLPGWSLPVGDLFSRL
ncbi:MAG: Uma2 family endonuclease [Bryobacterales bacterium]|nr:Uma2 family endonuclease [Bryobacterales bacterium]